VKHMNYDGDNFDSQSFAFNVDDVLMMFHKLMHYWSIVVQRLTL